MQWEYKRRVNKQAWHRWFAWRPIKINNTVYWLERVYRKGTIATTWNGDGFYWEWSYAANEFDLLRQVEPEKTISSRPKPPPPPRPKPPPPPPSRIIKF
jgi:hypothetical protein